MNALLAFIRSAGSDQCGPCWLGPVRSRSSLPTMPRTMPGRAAVTRIRRSAVAASGLIPSDSGSSSARQTCRISAALRKRSRGVMVPPGAGRSAKGLMVTNLRPGCFAHLNMPCRICLVWFAFAFLPRRIAMSAA